MPGLFPELPIDGDTGAQVEFYRYYRIGHDTIPEGWEPVGRPALIGGVYWSGVYVWTGEGEPC